MLVLIQIFAPETSIHFILFLKVISVFFQKMWLVLSAEGDEQHHASSIWLLFA
jgi:hypothetical protein